MGQLGLSVLLLLFSAECGLRGICGLIKLLNTSKYLPLKDQYLFLAEISKQAPNSLKLEVIGNTKIPGKEVTNDIFLVKIGKDTDPIIFFDCGIHAREWISSAACLYIIEQLTNGFEDPLSLNASTKDAVLRFQWQLIPMLNPDGYNISHSGSEFRMQRKNARPYTTMGLNTTQIQACRCHQNAEDCMGVDLNRNFPSGWGLGSKKFNEDSSLPCMEMYRGEHPLSEPETMALDKHVTSIKSRTLAAFSVHSYGQEIYHPKGWLSSEDKNQIKGKHLKAIQDFAHFFNQRLKFGLGNVASLLGVNDLEGGASDDYYWSRQGINITYTIELDPNLHDDDTGFMLPENKIPQVGAQFWDAVQNMAVKLNQLYPKSGN